MKKTIIIAIMLLACNLAVAQKLELKGEISSVIVYRGQALVTRSINIDLPEGSSELIVNDLPSRIIPESLYSQSPDGTKVLSLRYREKAIREDTREEVKKLDVEIDAIKKLLRHNKHAVDLRNYRSGRFSSLWSFSASSTKMDIDKSLLNAPGEFFRSND